MIFNRRNGPLGPHGLYKCILPQHSGRGNVEIVARIYSFLGKCAKHSKCCLSFKAHNLSLKQPFIVDFLELISNTHKKHRIYQKFLKFPYLI